MLSKQDDLKDLMTPRGLDNVGACETMDDKRTYLVKLKAQMLDAEIMAAKIALFAQRATNDVARKAANDNEARKAANEAHKATNGKRVYNNERTQTKEASVGFINPTFKMEDYSGGFEGNLDDITILSEDKSMCNRGNRGLVKTCLKEGYGQCSMAAEGNGNGGNGGSGSNGGSKYRGTNGTNEGGYVGHIRCYNCNGNHKIGNCPENCKKCDIPCGMKVWQCPVYLRNREKALKKEAGTERDDFLNKQYSSNNAKVQRLAKKITPQQQEIKTTDRKGIYGRTQTPQASDVSSDSDDSGDEESD